MASYKKLIWIISFLFFFTLKAQASHVRAADLKVEPVCSSPLTVKITITAYLNTLSRTSFGTNSFLYISDGTVIDLPTIATTPRPDLGTNVGVVTYSLYHTFSSYGTYKVTYLENHRNAGVLNIDNSGQVAYVTSIQFVIDPDNLCNHLPVLAVPPLDAACLQVAFYHSSGAYDVDGDSLSYEITVPASGETTTANYTSPVDKKFYLDFSKGNETDTGPPTFEINPVTGLLTWDAPGMLGEYNIAFNIIEWRKDSVTGEYFKLSTTVRDMQIEVDECVNNRPDLIIPKDTCVVAGAVIDVLIKGIDADYDPVKIEVYSEVLDLPAAKFPATYAPNPAQFVSSNPAAKLTFHWNTDCIHVRSQLYQVVFKITDNPPNGSHLVTFKVWNIKVVAPAPVIKNAVLDIAKHRAVLTWETYGCANASSIQIWRKVGHYDYTPGSCDVGLPRSLGYNLVGSVSAKDTTFTDNNGTAGLSPGAVYCYRVMAYFNSPAATPSIVSTEFCVGPVQADAPVITHVSIEKTAVKDGRIRVSWRSPLNINEVQFPKPYEYEIYRAEGFAGDTSIVKVGRVSDTTFVDTDMNTDEKKFNYRIVLYAQPALSVSMVPVDTSAVASSVRLYATPLAGQFELVWRDSVPWSNVVQERPYHLIYRGVDNLDDGRMTLLDSVQVATDGFTYIDSGPFESDVRYAYRVLTRGSYGNPAIRLQENFSQVVWAYISSDLPPCAPMVAVDKTDCDTYLSKNTCNQTDFANTIRWSVAGLTGCRKNIQYYKLYASSSISGEYTLVAEYLSDTVFVENSLPSYARCYQVSAVDKSGIESPLSEPVCNDNCPFFLLPNVLTPGNDGYNDTFSSNYDADVDAPEEVGLRCPRFVQQVNFKVFNRWGKAVYESNSQSGAPLTIEWNGVDSHGNEVSAGVYYYLAEVTFDVIDVKNKVKEYRGWVHVLR